MNSKLFLLAAGGTGGHLFPAQALASELSKRGHKVHLITDHRAQKYADTFPCDDMHIVQSATIGSKNPISLIKTGWALLKGLRQSGAVIRKIKPDAVIGFGGYPTIPPLLAATQAGRPSVVHEQNGVMGRANKMLSKRVTAIAGGFLTARGEHADKIIVTGNPVRQAVLDASKVEYQPSGSMETFNLVVFGGSQGARFFGETLPEALGLLSDDEKQRLHVTLQARDEDVSSANEICGSHHVSADIAPFFTDMAEKIADAHLVISRSGASTVSELAAIGRPAILVPYPYALDHDQAVNAKGMVDQGGALVVEQSELSAKKLSDLLSERMADPDGLAKTAANAKNAGRPNATSLLADMVEAVAEGEPLQDVRNKINENA